jgi:arylsulfatase A-like enzyme
LSRKGALSFGILFLVLWTVISCIPKFSAVQTGSNIIYIICDALRADHLGCYGYPIEVTPLLDALAREGTLFENNFSQSNATPYSMSSIFTGLYVPRHLYRFPSMTWWQICFTARLPGELWLPQLLRDAGYATCGINSNFILMPEHSQMEKGFDTYMFLEPEEMFGMYRPARAVFNLAEEWLNNNGERKFFLYLHTMEPHRPNRFTQPARRMLREWRQLYPDPKDQKRCREIAAYDADVKLHDEQLGRFLGYLEDRGFLDKTIVILGSDHGESLGENNLWWHGNTLLFQETHVPLIVAGNGVAKGKRVTMLTENVDILPTLLEIAGVDLPDSAICDGVSLVPLLSGTTMPIKDHGISVSSDYRFRSVFNTRYSYICHKAYEPVSVMENLTRFQVLSPFYPLTASMYDLTETSRGENATISELPGTVSAQLETWMMETERYFDRLRDSGRIQPNASFEYTVPQRVAPDGVWTKEIDPSDNLWTMRFFVSRSAYGMLLKGTGESPPPISLVFDAPPVSYRAYLVFSELSPDTCELKISTGGNAPKEIRYVPGRARSIPLGTFNGNEAPFVLRVESSSREADVAIERIECFPEEEEWSEEGYRRKKRIEERLKSLGYL